MYFVTEHPVFFLLYWKYPSHGLCGNEQHNTFITNTDFVQFVLLCSTFYLVQLRPDLRNL